MKAYKAGKSYFKVTHIPVISVLLIFILFSECNTTEPPINGKGITLKLEDVSCTEAWIKLSIDNSQLPIAVTLKQTSQTEEDKESTLNLSTADTLLYIDSLLPNKTYSYVASHSGLFGISSNELGITTMDTTSHDFTFTTYTFGGQAGTCTLYDVAIIDENNIWAVGAIYLLDSLGQPDPQAYGAAIWDGQSWKLKKLFYNSNIPVTPRGIFVISPSEIYLASGSIFRWDGSSSSVQLVYSRLNLPDPNATIEKLWGSSGSSIYGVGNAGTIVRYQNGAWGKIESGTDVNINDVFGITDQTSNQQKVFCAVSNVFEISDHKILTIDENNNIDSLHWDQDRRINSVWSDNGWIVYTSGGGVFNNKPGRWMEETAIPLYYTNRIRGNGLNDIFVAGDFGLLAHFSGTGWKIYNEYLFVASSLSISVNRDVIAAVGRQGGKALIIVGKRN